MVNIQTNLTRSEYIVTGSLVTGFSMFGAFFSFFFVLFLIGKQFQKRILEKSLGTRLLVYLQISSCLHNIVFAFSFASVFEPVCNIQAMNIQFWTWQSFLWNTSLPIYLILHMLLPQLKSIFEILCFIVINMLSFISVCLPFIPQNLYGHISGGIWCWISINKQPSPWGEIWIWSSFYIPIWFCILITLVLYICVVVLIILEYSKIKKNKIRKYKYSRFPSIEKEEVPLVSDKTDSPNDKSISSNSNSNDNNSIYIDRSNQFFEKELNSEINRRKRKIFFILKMIGYPLVFFLVWIFPTSHRIFNTYCQLYSYSAPNWVEITFIILHSFFQSIQGLLISIIYFFNPIQILLFCTRCFSSLKFSGDSKEYLQKNLEFINDDSDSSLMFSNVFLIKDKENDERRQSQTSEYLYQIKVRKKKIDEVENEDEDNQSIINNVGENSLEKSENLGD